MSTTAETALPVDAVPVRQNQGKGSTQKRDLSKKLRKYRENSDVLVPLAFATTIVGTILFSIWSTGAAFVFLLFSLLVWGFRTVPAVHNGLLYMVWVRRTRVGFSEGLIWIPWFLLARLQNIDAHQFTRDIAEQDNYSEGGWHITYDIVYHYGVCRVPEESFWRNCFRVFIVLFSGQANADGLYNFIQISDRQAAVKQIDSQASERTREAINQRDFNQIFNIKLGTGSTDVSVRSEVRQRIQEEVLAILDADAKKVGLSVFSVSLRDVDLHEDSARVIEQRVIAGVQGDAIKILYAAIQEAVEQMRRAGSDVVPAAIAMNAIKAVQESGQAGGLLGSFLTTAMLEKLGPLSSSSALVGKN